MRSMRVLARLRSHGDVLGVVFGLSFLVFPVVDLIANPVAWAHLALTLAGLAIFVATYLALILVGHRARDRRVVWAGLGLLTALAVAFTLDGGLRWYGLFVYTAAAAGFRLRSSKTLPVIVAVAGLGAVCGSVAGANAAALTALTLSTLAIGAGLAAFGAEITANFRLRAAQAEIARLAAVDERLRIARDLHDLLGHSLSVIALKSELAGKLVATDPDRAAAELADVTAVSRRALADVREAVGGYRRPHLSDALAEARTALRAAGIDCVVDVPEVRLASDAETVLAWAVREASTNVIRHSGAKQCTIRLRPGLRELELEVEDDGRGASDGARSGFGLAGLAERAERVRGRIDAAARPGGGFRLSVILPEGVP
jgi:two-component system sensor histidine kinase DesK